MKFEDRNPISALLILVFWTSAPVVAATLVAFKLHPLYGAVIALMATSFVTHNLPTYRDEIVLMRKRRAVNKVFERLSGRILPFRAGEIFQQFMSGVPLMLGATAMVLVSPAVSILGVLRGFQDHAAEEKRTAA
jgi:hypothetical protein